MRGLFGLCCVSRNSGEERKTNMPTSKNCENNVYRSFNELDEAIKNQLRDTNKQCQTLVQNFMLQDLGKAEKNTSYQNQRIKRQKVIDSFNLGDIKKSNFLKKVLQTNCLQSQDHTDYLDFEKLVCFVAVYGEGPDQQKYKLLYELMLDKKTNAVSFNSGNIARILEHLIRITTIELSAFIYHNVKELLPDIDDQQYFYDLKEKLELSKNHILKAYCAQQQNWFFPMGKHKQTGLDFTKFSDVLNQERIFINADKIRRQFCEYLIKNDIAVRSSIASDLQSSLIKPNQSTYRKNYAKEIPEELKEQDSIMDYVKPVSAKQQVSFDLQAKQIQSKDIIQSKKSLESDDFADFSRPISLRQKEQPFDATASAIHNIESFQDISKDRKRKKDKKDKKDKKKDKKGKKEKDISMAKDQYFQATFGTKAQLSQDKSFGNEPSINQSVYSKQNPNSSKLNNTRQSIIQQIRVTQKTEKKIEEHLISSFGEDFYQLVVKMSLEIQADIEQDVNSENQNVEFNQDLLKSRRDRFIQNAQFINSKNFSLQFTEEIQSFFLKEMMQLYKSTVRPVDIQNLLNGKLIGENMITLYFKILERIHNLLDAAQSYLTSGKTPDPRTNEGQVYKVQYLNANFLRKLRKEQSLENLKRDSSMVQELKKVLNSQRVILPFFFDNNSRQGTYNSIADSIVGEPVIVVIYPEQLRIDLYDRSNLRDSDINQQRSKLPVFIFQMMKCLIKLQDYLNGRLSLIQNQMWTLVKLMEPQKKSRLKIKKNTWFVWLTQPLSQVFLNQYV